MEVQGVIKELKETETFGSNGFRKREVVITTDEQYPQHILLEFVQDKCDVLNSYAVGDNVKIGINIRGREWVNPQGETKYFNSLQGWNITKLGAEKKAPAAAFEPATDLKEENIDDGIPF